MNRFLVFAYEAYYPGGGWSDFKKSFANGVEAIEYANTLLNHYSGGVEVVDLECEQDIYIYPARENREAP